MKVIPHIKQKRLAYNEVRFITIDRAAMEELLLENLMEHQNDYFDIRDGEIDSMCVMNIDYQNNLLTYAIMPSKYCFNGYKLNFEKLNKKFGKTTESLFTKKKYQVITLTEEYLIKARSAGDRGQGDGSVVPSQENEINPN